MGWVVAEVGVALQTVFVAFATKSGLLRALWDLPLKGDRFQAGLLGTVAAGQDYVRLEQHAVEPDPSGSCAATPKRRCGQR
jgi:hypothetical protein